MNILFINQYYYPDPAATAQILTELCTDLSRWFNVTVVTGFPSYNKTEGAGGRLIKQISMDGVKVIRVYNTILPRQSMVGRIFNYISFLLFSLFGAIFFTGKQDAVVTMTDPPVVSIVGYIVSKIKKAPYIYVIQDLYPDVIVRLGKLNNKLIIRMLSWLNLISINKAKKVVVIGEMMRKKLIEKGVNPAKIEIIRNWADTNLVTPESKVNRFSKRYGFWNKFVVMYSGNIGLAQDLEVLIKAASLLKDNGEITFIIIGNGVEKEKLQQKARDLSLNNINFIPYQDKESLKYSLSSADISIISNKKGTAGYRVPSKLYGILASGRPILAIIEDESEVAKIVKEEKCGVVIEPGNPQKLAEVINFLYKNEVLCKEYGKNSRVAAEKYSREKSVMKYRELFERIGSNWVKTLEYSDLCSE